MPASGKVLIDGKDIFAMDDRKRTIFRRRNIGFIFQAFNLIPELTVEQNIIFPVLLDYQKPDKKYLEELLTVLNLKERRNHLPSQLSGGQQQRVAIGRALITRPTLILADEPTGNLDTQNSSEVIALLKETSKKYEQTILMITHNRSIAQTADRVLQVSDGCLTDFGRAQDVRGTSALLYRRGRRTRMNSYLSLIPISAKVHRRQNRMTLLCIIFAVFMVTTVFSMAEMGIRMEETRLVGKHGNLSMGDLLGSSMGQTLLPVAVILFLLILIAGVLMISGSMNSSVAQRIKFFGMMRCIGMSKQQIVHFVRLEALNWCKTAVPVGLALGIVTTWGLCAILRFLVGEEFSEIPLFGVSIVGIVCGILVGVITVLFAANAPAKRASKVSPAAAVSGNTGSEKTIRYAAHIRWGKIEMMLGIHHAASNKKNLILMTSSFLHSVLSCFQFFCDD